MYMNADVIWMAQTGRLEMEKNGNLIILTVIQDYYREAQEL